MCPIFLQSDLIKCSSVQVELRSYVSEPELETIGSDLSQPSAGFLGTDSRYQTLPSRGKLRDSPIHINIDSKLFSSI